MKSRRHLSRAASDSDKYECKKGCLPAGPVYEYPEG